ncbi:MAG: sulfite exporter TauE/SafE family protein [Pyrobaculum sp.]
MDWTLPLVSFAVSLFTSMVGVSGAFLLLPFQMSILGFTTPSVSGTNLVYNLLATPSGIFRYLREGRLLWPLALPAAMGSLPGVALGAYARAYWLADVKTFKLFAAAVLLILGLRLLATRHTPKATPTAATIIKTRPAKVVYRLGGETYSFSPPALTCLSAAVGLVGGAYGIGGGALLAPILATVFKLPIYTTAGATLLTTFLTSTFGIATYHALGHPPRWDIGIALGIGGAFGMYTGAHLQKYIPEKTLRTTLAAITFIIATTYIANP